MRQIQAIAPSGYSFLGRTGGEAEKYERPRSSGRLSTLCSSTMRPHGRLSNSHLRLQSPVQAVGVLPLVLHSPSTFCSLRAGTLTHSPACSHTPRVYSVTPFLPLQRRHGSPDPAQWCILQKTYPGPRKTIVTSGIHSRTLQPVSLEPH